MVLKSTKKVNWKSHGPTKGGGGRGLSSQGLLKVNIFFLLTSLKSKHRIEDKNKESFHFFTKLQHFLNIPSNVNISSLNSWIWFKALVLSICQLEVLVLDTLSQHCLSICSYLTNLSRLVLEFLANSIPACKEKHQPRPKKDQILEKCNNLTSSVTSFWK